jgi:hypothetical protein
MTTDSDLVTVFAGPIVEAEYLKKFLLDNHVHVFMRNEMQSGLAAGFGAATPGTAVQLRVHRDEYDRAKELIQEYNEGA